MPRRFMVLAMLVCSLWASVGIVIKATLADAPPLGLGAIRMLVSGAVLWAWLTWRSRVGAPSRWIGVPWRLVSLATLFYMLLQGFTHTGFNHTSAARGIVLLNTTPLFVAALVHFVAPQERLNAIKLVGIALAFAGVYAIFARSFDAGGTRLGDLLMLSAALSWSLHTLVTKRAAQRMDSGSLMLVQFLGAGMALALLSAAVEPPSAWHATPKLAAGVAYLAVVGTVVSWMLWVYVLKNVQAGAASSFIFSVPLIGIALSWLLLGERVTLPFIVGALMVSLGITLVNWRRAPTTPTSDPTRAVS